MTYNNNNNKKKTKAIQMFTSSIGAQVYKFIYHQHIFQRTINKDLLSW